MRYIISYSYSSTGAVEKIQGRDDDIPNPSREASTISPGSMSKNFLPTLEFATELVKNPETLITPDSTPVATFSVIFVTLLTLNKS